MSQFPISFVWLGVDIIIYVLISYLIDLGINLLFQKKKDVEIIQKTEKIKTNITRESKKEVVKREDLDWSSSLDQSL